ncbi:MAG: hypothetical protein MUO77_05230 [Anaerolineales bacterium]|nr:hypothetical protein [Anaerolineales bacterium]
MIPYFGWVVVTDWARELRILSNGIGGNALAIVCSSLPYPNNFGKPLPPVFCIVFINFCASRNYLIRQLTACTSMPANHKVIYSKHCIK